MKVGLQAGMIAVIAIVGVVVPVFAESVTVGRFYSEIALAKNLGSADAASAEASLRSSGVILPKFGLDKELTEGDMVLIATTLGVAVNTHRPSQPISDTQLSTFMSVFGRNLGAPKAAGDVPFETDGKHRHGHGHGHHDHSCSRP